MEQSVLFEQKIALTPKDMNRMGKETIDSLLLAQLRQNLEGKCSQHGFVIQNSLEIISRSMGQLEHGRYTGNIVFHIQVQGKVYNPANGTRIRGKIDKKNLPLPDINFIEEIIDNDLKSGKYEQIVTRFPPEPNGYLHLGHASAICFNLCITKML
jgi:hypothetical protein